jgi:hypothetical protein
MFHRVLKRGNRCVGLIFSREKLFILDGVQEHLEKAQKELAELRRAHEDMRLSAETHRITDAELISVLKKSIDELNSDKASAAFFFSFLLLSTLVSLLKTCIMDKKK